MPASSSATDVKLTWGTADNGGSTITGHQYRQSSDSGSAWSPDWSDITDSGAGGTNEGGYTVTSGLTSGTTYTFQVRAVNDQGFGGSAEATVTAQANVDSARSEALERDDDRACARADL